MNVSFEGTTEKGSAEWLTPPTLLKCLGSFDLDPCTPINRPWDTAKKHYTKIDDGLSKKWEGRVWCNPPYGKYTSSWLEKCSTHGNCLVLIFARTETRMFFKHIWDNASAIFFIKGRLRFYHNDGTQGGTAGAPSVLIAYGTNNANVLENCKLSGKYIKLKYNELRED